MILANGTKVEINDTVDPSRGIRGMRATVVHPVTAHNLGFRVRYGEKAEAGGHRVELDNGTRYDVLESELTILDGDKLAEGYRIVDSVRGLVELPEFSYVRAHDGFRHEKQDDGGWLIVGGSASSYDESSIELPVTVLFEPEAPKLRTIRERARAAARIEWQVRVAEGVQGTPKDHADAVADAVLKVLFPDSSE